MYMDNIITRSFNFEGFREVRTQLNTETKEVLFCGKDVATALGYKKPEKAISDHCRRASLVAVSDSPIQGVTSKARHTQTMKFIPEPDVYRLVMKSRLKSAEKFEIWVCEEVLPAIRKSGMYSKTITESKILPEVQAELMLHFESRMSDMIKRIDKIDRYGGLCYEGQMSVASGIAREFGVPTSLIYTLIQQGQRGISES